MVLHDSLPSMATRFLVVAVCWAPWPQIPNSVGRTVHFGRGISKLDVRFQVLANALMTDGRVSLNPDGSTELAPVSRTET